jgi:hypothetical protein
MRAASICDDSKVALTLRLSGCRKSLTAVWLLTQEFLFADQLKPALPCLLHLYGRIVMNA